MRYMIIEKFKPGKVKELYERFQERGRMLPEGVTYMNSWINVDVTVCYQEMESDAEEKILEWIRSWNDLADSEIVPVITSEAAKNKALGEQL